MKHLTNIIIVAFFWISYVIPAYAATTYYVRTDGGTSAQCTGLADAAYPGSGTAQACAFNHPFWLLKPNGSAGLSGAEILQGGDTAVISNGSYMMGIGAPNSTSCNAAWAYDCTLPPIPSGPDATHPTKIYGKNYDTKLTPAPELWGYGRAGKVLNLAGSNNVEVRYLEITDHSACIYNSPDPAKVCNDASPYNQPTARAGIYAVDSTNVLLKDLNIHGISKTGIWAGRLTDWTLDGVVVRASGSIGWDGDVGHGALDSATESSNHGTITIKNSKIEYSGCGEQYPANTIYGCFGQSQGGYGDGLGLYQDGANWIFDNVEISHNTQDGLDMLYHVGPSRGTVIIKNSRFEGNAGNQVKESTNTQIENSVIIGNCDYFYNNPISETYGGSSMDNCRANGTPLFTGGWGATSDRSPNLSPGTSFVTLVNSLLTGTATIMIETKGNSCVGTERLTSRNNILLGMEGWYKKHNGEPGWKPDLFYLSGSDGNGTGPCGAVGTTAVQFDNKDSIAYYTKTNQCPNSNNVLCVDPMLTAIPFLINANDIWTYGARWNVMPLVGSPAIDQSSSAVGTVVLGSVVVPSIDILGGTRPYGSGIDWGPYEYRPDSTPPVITISPVVSPTNLTTQNLCGTVTDNNGVDSVTVQLGSLTPQTATVISNSWSCNVSGLISGTNTIKVTAKDIYGNTSLAYANIVIDTTPPPSVATSTATASSGGGSGGCFIATAAYGSYLHPQVQVLRNFRDTYLLTNSPGRAFVALYYHFSPPIADFISQHEMLRLLVRLLLTPMVLMVANPEISLLFVMIVLASWLIRRQLRKSEPVIDVSAG